MNLFSKLTCSTLLSVLLSVPMISTAQAADAAKGNTAAKSAPATGAPVITFNRLLRAKGRRHLPPPEDGMRDTSNPDVNLLQPPLDVLPNYPQTESGAGNGVAWVKAYSQIKPRWDRMDPNAEPMVMDMGVIRVVKGKMPNVLFPHKAHTEWLDCSNCHPDIFIPQKGANQISMAAIILGQKCGVCHGKVAFPITECKFCHSQPKEVAGTK